jgi:hypothetical protein
VTTHCRTRLLPDDREDGHVVHAGIVESGNQMGRSRPGCGNTHAKLARKLRMYTGHERGHFLVSRLNEIDLSCARRIAPNTPLMPSPG